MTSSLSVTWVVNNTTPDLDLDKSRGIYKVTGEKNSKRLTVSQPPFLCFWFSS